YTRNCSIRECNYEGWFTLSIDGSFRSHSKVAAAGGVIRTDTGRFVRHLLRIWGAALLLERRCELLWMVYNSPGLWEFDGYGSIPIRERPLLFLGRSLIWIINMRPLSCS
ncbi:hypothetical protein LINGRAHAP2_LOCUS24204, partial [Linum grandiflorum]